jgi:hypothetical protein
VSSLDLDAVVSGDIIERTPRKLWQDLASDPNGANPSTIKTLTR